MKQKLPKVNRDLAEKLLTAKQEENLTSKGKKKAKVSNIQLMITQSV